MSRRKVKLAFALSWSALSVVLGFACAWAADVAADWYERPAKSRPIVIHVVHHGSIREYNHDVAVEPE